MKQTTETTHPTQRDVSFDFLRVLACLMVVVMHAQPSTSQESSLWLSISSYATSPCIGLFFMISGALRLTRPITDYGAYFKGIFRRIVVRLGSLVHCKIMHRGLMLRPISFFCASTTRHCGLSFPSWVYISLLPSCNHGCKQVVKDNNGAILSFGFAHFAYLG